MKKRYLLLGLGLAAVIIYCSVLQIQPTSAAKPKTVVPVASSSIIKTGTWETGAEGTRNSNHTGATVTFHFSGPYIALKAWPGPNKGIAHVAIDGIPYPSIDMYQPAYASSASEYIIASTLSPGSHEITITVSGTKNSLAVDHYLVLESFVFEKDFYHSSKVSSDAVKLTGAWYNGTEGTKNSNQTGAEASFTFYGNNISLLAWPGANKGIATIEIDGVPIPSIDFYAPGYPSSPSQYLLSDSLATGLHTVVIRVAGTSNSAASDNYLVLDSFLVESVNSNGEIFYQQEIVSHVADHVVPNPNTAFAPLDKLALASYMLHLFLPGGQYTSPVTGWNLGDYTGSMTPAPLADFQQSVAESSTRPGSTAFQAFDNIVGAVNSPHLYPEAVSAITGDRIFAVHPIQYEFSPSKSFFPFKDHQYLVMEFEAKLPTATSHSTGGIGYFGPNMTIKDRSTNTVFYIGTQIYDNRTSVSENLIIDACSACSGNVIVGTVLKPDSQYIGAMEGSGTFRSSPWNEFEYFGWSISKDQFQTIINQIKLSHPGKPISDNLEDFEIVAFLVGLETVLPHPADQFSLGTSLRNFKLIGADSIITQ